MGANAGPDVRVCRLLHHNATAFAIDASTGRLKPLNQQETGGTNGVHLAVDPSNRFLVVSNYSSGSVVVLPINADGSLAPLSDLVQLQGKPGPQIYD